MFHSEGNSVARLYAWLYAALSLLSTAASMNARFHMGYAPALLAGGLWLILPPVVQAIDFDYQLIAGPNTPMPGGSGSFGAVGNPTMYGGVVAFAGGTSFGEGLYTYDAGTLSLLADITTPIPAGTGNFTNYGSPTIHDGMLAFTGQGSGGQLGIYCYNGAVNRVADLNTPIPGGTGTFTEFGRPWMHDGGIVFRGRGANGQDGIYTFGKGVLRVVANTNTPIPGGTGNFTNFGHVSSTTGVLFGTPTAENGVFVFTGGDGERQQGIYTESGGTFSVVADTSTKIPDGTGNFIDFREAGLAANIYDGDIAFLAEGESDQLGIYLRSGNTFSKIVDRNDEVPGQGVRFNGIAAQGMGLDNGNVSFLGTAVGNGRGNVYTTLGGSLTSVIDDGVLLEGRAAGSLGTYGQGIEGPLVLFNTGFWGKLGDTANFVAIAEYHWTGQGGGWTGPTDGEWDNRANWLVGRLPRDVVDTFIDPDASITVVGPAADTQLRQLQIGGGAGIATLQLQSGATIAANAGVIIQDTGVLTGDGVIDGNVTNLGTIVADNITGVGRFDNEGIVSGSGRIHADSFANSGEVRVSAGDHLRLTGAAFLNRSGRVQAIGTASSPAEIEFDGAVTNVPGGLIAGRNAVMRFDGGLANEASLAISFGVSDIFGDIDNTGTVAVTGGAAATFYDDMIQNGTFQVSKVGSTTSVAVVLGDFSGAGGSSGGGDIFFEGDLRPGNSTATVSYANNVSFGSAATLEIELGGLNAGDEYDRVDITGMATLDGLLGVSLLGDFEPGAGDAFEILTAAGGVTGTFATELLPALAGDLFWNINYDADSVSLAVAAPGLPGDYNQDGSVDAADYVMWRKTDGAPEGYNTWRANFGRTAEVGAASRAALSPRLGEPTAAVPEPSAIFLSLGLAGTLLASRRMRPTINPARRAASTQTLHRSRSCGLTGDHNRKDRSCSHEIRIASAAGSPVWRPRFSRHRHGRR